MNNFLLSTFISFAILCNPVMAKEVYPSYDIPLSSYQQQYTQEVCEKYDLSYELILAIMYVESKFNPNAISYNGTSHGIMQINSNTSPWIAKQMGIKKYDVYNFGHSVSLGIWYLDYLRNYWLKQGYSDEECFNLMLLSYHKGINGCKNYVKQHGLKSEYVNSIYKYKIKLEEGEI